MALANQLQCMADLSEQIETIAAAPKRTTTDAGTVEEHDLDELIAADRYLKEQAAAAAPHRRIGYGKFVPPGTT